MQPLNTLDGLFFPGLEADGVLTAVGMPLSKSDDEWCELPRLEDDFVGKDLVILIGVHVLGQSCQQLESRRLLALVQLVDVDDPRKQQESRGSILGRAGLVEDNNVHQTQDDCLQWRSPGAEDGEETVVEQMQQLLMGVSDSI